MILQTVAQPRGIVARLRHSIGPLLPAILRRAGARVLDGIEARSGATYEIAGRRLRFAKGSAPTVLTHNSDERATFDALQLAAFANAIRPGDVVADVGSYRGTYAVVAATRVGERGQVVAFEPTQANRDIITTNIALNGFTDRVVIEAAAVSDRTGTATFYAWGDATSNSLARTEGQSRGIPVRTVTLDEYFAGGRLPDVVKIDIEGAELLALNGARRILASDARIICELHPYAWKELRYNADDLTDLLEQYGRTAIDLQTGEKVEEYRYGVVWLAKRNSL